MLALGRLLRLSLSPSAPADVAAGIVFAAGTWPQGSGPWLLLGASLSVYHGGLALNDWADRERDARTCPARPLPAGALAPRTALGLALVLLAGGPLLAWWVLPTAGCIAALVALAAVIYDTVGRGPWRGPLLLGLCRAGNLGLGLALGASGGPTAEAVAPAAVATWLAPALLYGLYVCTVSRLGRLEDGEDGGPPGRRPTRFLLAAAAVLLLVPLLPLPRIPPREKLLLGLAGARLVAFCLAGLGAVLLARRALRPGPWTAAEVRSAMGTALRALLVFTAALAVRPGSPAAVAVAGAILLGYPVGYGLRRAFPPS